MRGDGELTAVRAKAELLVDLINTLYLGDGSDLLASAEADGWIRARLPNSRAGSPGRELDLLRRIREGLRELAYANNGGRPDRDAVARAEEALRGVPLVVTGLGDGIGLIPAGRHGPGASMVAMVAGALLSTRSGGGWQRVKACAQPECRWAFFDMSRNGSRRWCAMSECGNRAKNRAWRARREA